MSLKYCLHLYSKRKSNSPLSVLYHEKSFLIQYDSDSSYSFQVKLSQNVLAGTLEQFVFTVHCGYCHDMQDNSDSSHG